VKGRTWFVRCYSLARQPGATPADRQRLELSRTHLLGARKLGLSAEEVGSIKGFSTRFSGRPALPIYPAGDARSRAYLTLATTLPEFLEPTRLAQGIVPGSTPRPQPRPCGLCLRDAGVVGRAGVREGIAMRARVGPDGMLTLGGLQARAVLGAGGLRNNKHERDGANLLQVGSNSR